jgi:thiamine transport system permease protein
MSLLEDLTHLVSGRLFRKGWLAFIIFFFLVFVILPTVFVLTYAITDWNSIQTFVLNDPAMTNQIVNVVLVSFEIAAIVTAIDFAVGLPMAWIMVRKQFRGKRYLDTLIDMPLVVPTAALGFSAAIFWGITPATLSNPFGLEVVSSPLLLVILLHIVFSYPYMVRSLAAILEQIDVTYETAGQTLGASKFTAARTITLPLFRAGVVTGIILCFARSLSETGGTVIALATLATRNGFDTAPTLLNAWRPLANTQVQYQAALAFVSILLIIFALVLLVVLSILVKKVRLPAGKVWPRWEKILSRGVVPRLKDGSALVFMAVIVIIPTFFIFSFAATATPTGSSNWAGFGDALVYSFVVAGVVTVADLFLGIPLALYLARGRRRKLPQSLDILVNIPLIVPTVALGYSLSLFYVGGKAVSTSVGIVLVILAHIAFTYPLVVRNVAGAVEEIDPSFEETARTLGAKPIQAFRRVLYPMIKSSILAGAIMAFTRSLGETGATTAVVSNANTAPLYIVNLIAPKAGGPDYYTAALACIVLIIISYMLMLTLRVATRRGKGAK